VQLASGAWFEVLTEQEAEYVETLVAGYGQFELTHTSDIADLDRLIQMETLINRWATWSATLKTYDEGKVDQVDMQRRIKETSTEVRQLKKALGIDKLNRDKARGEGSIPHLWASVLARAQQQGLMRNDQFDVALELAHEVIAQVEFHDNCTEREREMFGCTPEGILDWLRDVYKPRFEEIDAVYRETHQRHWIRKMQVNQ
jgi:hypothetical protein